jgi:phage terminase Nu1 subunit (DNA packaging protein)
MKTTQDMHIWLNNLASILEEELLSVEQFSDKSFRINAHNGETVETLYDSDDAMELIDINDLAYHDPKEFAEIIKQGKDLGNVDVSAL